MLRIIRGIGIRHIGVSAFLEVVLIKDYIIDIKDKEYATEVVIIAKKLLLDGFIDIKDSLGEAQN